MRSAAGRSLLGCLLLVSLSRCDCGSAVSAASSTLPGSCEEAEPIVAAQKTDILFVIDNSNSMSEEQDKVATELSAFVDALRSGSGLEQDFQFGVITTGVYRRALIGNQDTYLDYPDQSGQLRAVPSTGEKVLSGADPDVVTKFAELVRQGTSGSGQETPFEAARLAVATELADLPQSVGGNLGFLRSGARLLVVVVTDEDDCSEVVRPPTVRIETDPAVNICTRDSANLTPAVAYEAVFRSLEDADGSTREVLWAAIAPVARSDKTAEEVVIGGVAQNVDCPTSFQGGMRHREMAALFDPALENLESICNDSYRDGLLRIALLATLGQSVEVMSAPDERLLLVEVDRADGTTEKCTVANGGIRYSPKTGDRSARVLFQNQCVRRAADTGVRVRLLCAG